MEDRVQNGSGAPPSLLSMGTGGSFPGGKAAGGVKLTTYLHVVPRSRMRGAISPLTQYAFMAWCLVKQRDNFTLPFTLLRTDDKLLSKIL
jgi:hypothetical protein